MSLRPAARAFVIGLALAVAAGLVPTAPVAAQNVTIERNAGADRYATSAATSAATYPSGVPVAYIARGDLFPDALAAGPAAALGGGPVLIVRPNQLPAPIADELRRLAPQRLVVVGGEGAVTAGMFDVLSGYHTGGGITRVAGGDRYATAAAVSSATFTGGGTVYIATGTAFPDALSGGAAAARDGAPMLLTAPTELPQVTRDELARLSPTRIVVLGGSGAVAESVVDQLAAYTTGSVERLAGADRYGTSVAVARTFGAPGSVFVATGRNFPDALTAVTAAARHGAPVLLTAGTDVPMRSDVRSVIAELSPASVTIVGGAGVVHDSVALEIRATIDGVPPLPACTYEDISTPLTDTRDWRATLIDTRLALPSTYVPPDLVSTANAGLSASYSIRAIVVRDLAALVSAAAANGTPVDIVSAYRSHQTQEQTFNYWVSVGGYEQALRTSARPGHSEHQLGTTLDFTSQGGAAPWDYADWGQTPAGAWMAQNAWRYGFIMSYPAGTFDVTCYDYEPWHYRYVGRDVAVQVVQSGLTLRQWLWQQGYGVGTAP